MNGNNTLQFNWFDENCITENYSSQMCSSEITFRNISEAYPYMRRASLEFKIVFCIAALFFTLSGLFLKSIIFAFLCSPSETATTINVLIFVQQFHRITFAVNYLWFGVAYLLPFSLEDILGGTFCTLFSAVEVFSFFGNIYWSFALAITRLLYVKYNRFLR